MKPIVSICGYFMATALAVGHGTVLFRTKGWVDVPFFDDRGIRLEGPNYLAQLYFWKTGDGFQAAGSPVPFATNGYFYGRTVILPFVEECSPAWVQVRAWQADAGATFEKAALGGAWTGVSGALFLPQTGSPTRPEACSSATLFGLQYPGSPLVVRQPQDQTVRAREPATLSVIASSGVAAAFQWHQRPSDRPDGLIPGATNATYTTPALRTSTTFWVSVTNSAGSTTSERATVTVVGSGLPWLTVRRDGRVPALTLEGVTGTFHQVEYSTNLGAATWTPLRSFTVSSGSYTFHDDDATNSPMRFYRAVAP